MHIDPYIVLGSAIIGLLVGMTGAGGGALITPMLILLFGIKPSTAISSDLVAAVVMRPIGAAVHMRAGTVNLKLVRWMVLGSVPSAFLGAYLLHLMGNAKSAENNIEVFLGAALLVGAGAMVLRFVLDRAAGHARTAYVTDVHPRPLLTLAIGIVGGIIVGMTSVGSGSLMIVGLLFIYPMLGANQLVGTDLTQAVPLTLAAALGALAFGHVELSVTGSLMIGSVPAVLVGSLLSSSVPERYVRPAIAFVIFASGLKYVGVGTTALGWILCATLFAGAGGWLAMARPWTTPSVRRAPIKQPPRARMPTYSRGRTPSWPMSNRVDVPVAGGALATYRLGAVDPTAPSVLAVHGITSTSRTWLAVARALGERAALIAVDLRGRGRSSELPPPFGIDAHVRDMLAVLDHFGIDRRVVAGHSLGAYIAAQLAADHPERVQRLVLVDGGLTIPGSEGVDPERFLQAFLGPTLERLEMTLPDPGAYRDWWAAHPAIAGSDMDPADLEQYAAHDLAGEPPRLRSSVNPQVVRDDGLDLAEAAGAVSQPATFLCAPRGMIDDPNPMQPLELVQRWAAADPERRVALEVPDVNHYTIVFGRAGAAAVADQVAAAAGPGVRKHPRRELNSRRR